MSLAFFNSTLRILTVCTLVIIPGCKLGGVSDDAHDLAGSPSHSCPHFDRSQGGQAPERLVFKWGQDTFTGERIGCGSAGVAYAFQGPLCQMKVAKVFYADLTSAVIYPEVALFVDKKPEISRLSPQFAQNLVPSSKARIEVGGRFFQALIKDFQGTLTLSAAPASVIDQFFYLYRDLHDKSLNLKAGKFYVTDLKEDNIHFSQGKLWIIDGHVGGVPPGSRVTFEAICQRQLWCKSRLEALGKSP